MLEQLVEDLRDEERVQVFRTLSLPLATQTFEQLDLSAQRRLLNALTVEESTRVLDGMAPDDRTALLEELPGEVADRRRFTDLKLRRPFLIL